MSDQAHLRLIYRGPAFWNQWRQSNPNVTPDLSGENLSASLRVATMGLWHNGAPIIDPQPINLRGINLSNANLQSANLSGQDLTEANLKWANLSNANLTGCRLIDADLTGACLDGCQAFGVSVWLANLDQASQRGIIITQHEAPEITCDSLAMAQFLHLILDNQAVRDALTTLSNKTVLILGRFSQEIKIVLDALRDALRRSDYAPIMFDFEKPQTRGFMETITTLARLARFIIADITDAAEVRAELTSIIPNLPSVPVQPIVANEPYATFEDWKKYPWVLPIFRYDSHSTLMAALAKEVIEPVETWLTHQRSPSA